MKPREIFNRIGSLQLTLLLLLILALVSALGTFLPQTSDVSPYRDVIGPASAQVVRVMALNHLYHSAWFRAPLALLCLNLVVCMALRVPSMICSARGEAALRRDPVLVIPWSEEAAAAVRARLRGLGYRARPSAAENVFSRHEAAFAVSIVAHASILLIMAFAVAGSALGFVGTHRMYVGDVATACYDWSLGRDRELPFSVRPEDLVHVANPVSLKLGVRQIASGDKKGLLVTHVGGRVRVPGVEGELRIDSYDAEAKNFSGTWSRDGAEAPYLGGEPLGSTGLSLIVVAYVSWPAREVYVPTSLLEGGAVAAAGDIAPNRPLSHRGVDVFLTDYGTDARGFPYVGFQFVHDPVRWGVWVGSCLFLAAMAASLFLRHRCVVLVRDGDTMRIHLSARGDRAPVADELCRAIGPIVPNGAPP